MPYRTLDPMLPGMEEYGESWFGREQDMEKRGSTEYYSNIAIALVARLS